MLKIRKTIRNYSLSDLKNYLQQIICCYYRLKACVFMHTPHNFKFHIKELEKSTEKFIFHNNTREISAANNVQNSR